MNARRIYSPVFLIPAIVLYTVFFIVPVISGIVFSLTDWNSLRPHIRFIGLANYGRILKSSGGPYLMSLFNTLAFTVGTVLLKTLVGLALAIALNEGFRTSKVLRALFFSTYTLSALIVGIVFVSILSGHGLLNYLLEHLGLKVLARSWLSNPHTALASTMVVEVWRMAGWNMMIFLAGLQMIPKDFYEAADMDGAGPLFKFLRITIPFLVPSITVAVVLNTIHGLKVFDMIYALTGGGPGSLTEVINTQVFKEFGDGRYGMSNALGVMVFLLTALVAIYMKRLLSRGEIEA